MTDNFGQNKFNKRPEDGLKIVSACPVCKREHNPFETSVIDENGNAHLLYIKCRNCGSNVVAMVMMGAMGITSLGVVTDLESREVLEFKDQDRITAFDVLDIYENATINDFYNPVLTIAKKSVKIGE